MRSRQRRLRRVPGLQQRLYRYHPPPPRALQPSAWPAPHHQAPRSARGRTRAARSLRLRRLRYHPHRAQTMTRNPADLLLNEHLDYLKLTCVKENCQPLAVESAAPTTGAISTTWVGSFRAKSRHVNSARLLGGSKPPVLPSSRPWKASAETGPKKSNPSRATTSSGLLFSMRLPTLFSSLSCPACNSTSPSR